MTKRAKIFWAIALIACLVILAIVLQAELAKRAARELCLEEGGLRIVHTIPPDMDLIHLRDSRDKENTPEISSNDEKAALYYRIDTIEPFKYYPQIKASGWTINSYDGELLGKYLQVGYNGNMLTYSIKKFFYPLNPFYDTNNLCDAGRDLESQDPLGLDFNGLINPIPVMTVQKLKFSTGEVSDAK